LFRGLLAAVGEQLAALVSGSAAAPADRWDGVEVLGLPLDPVTIR
jgi:hypothetical protein